MATKKNQVATKEDANVAAWGDYVGGQTGFEDMDRSELAIPFINLLQSNSEMVEDDKAKAGQLYNNVMETIHDDLTIVPCARQRVFVEWVPVDDGGGLVAVHEPDSAFVQEALASNDGNAVGLKVNGGKHDLVETIYLYVLVLDGDGGHERAVISFSSSKLKRYRQFITKATSQMLAVNGRKFQLPLWAHRWKVTSDQDISKAGQKFRNIVLSWDGENAKECRLTPSDELFQAGEDFHDMVRGGLARADVSTADDDSAGSGQTQSDGGQDDDEIPF